jgi:hypothetical protein
MALHSHDHGSPSGLPLAAVLGAIPSYPRPVIERLVLKLIEHLDEQDGDPDLELTWPERHSSWQLQQPWRCHGTDDDEDTHDAERDDG